MAESEATTRKNRIDAKLRSSLLNWTIIHNDKVSDYSSLSSHAVEEYPTTTGPADYALFVSGKLLGIIEAKKVSVGAENVLEQAKRYARSVANTVGEWREYKVPFLYSTNGESIFHLDVRKKENSSHQLIDFHSPQALLDKYNRDSEKAEKWFYEPCLKISKNVTDRTPTGKPNAKIRVKRAVSENSVIHRLKTGVLTWISPGLKTKTSKIRTLCQSLSFWWLMPLLNWVPVLMNYS